MTAQIKTDFEKWLIANHLTQELNKFYFMVGAQKVYVYFEGQSAEGEDAFINLRIEPKERSKVGTGTVYHRGLFKFYIYGLNALVPDRITDALATILDEKTIEHTQSFRIETGVMTTKYRGNKFAESDHYENIVEIEFSHWS